MKYNIYLDNAATMKLCEAAKIEASRVNNQLYFNTASSYATAERKLLKECEDVIRQKLGVLGGTVIFTSGATEANNLAIFGIINHPSKKIVIGDAEHASVYQPAMFLKGKGFNVQIGGDCDNATLYSKMFVNSDTGEISVYKELPKGVLLHIDAAQAFCKTKIPLAHLITISSHKIGGPKGVGALWIADGFGASLQPQIYGGNQQLLRSGTIPLAAIAGFAAAAKDYSNDNVKILSDYLKSKLPSNYTINGNSTIPNIISINLPQAKGEIIMNALATKGIYISTGSACSGKGEVNRTLKAMGHKKPQSVIRVSLSPNNTKEEIDIFIKELIYANDNFS
ncbi:MAG: aminotransferase class V-fold PLP-dependent enzyme [Firmicutes bacterium]|nr:aminotransferase class V-fold PLP-dependent enzyme [Bacillota bacterium]